MATRPLLKYNMCDLTKSQDPAIKDENRRIRHFRFLTDLTMQILYIERITLAEAWNLVADLRKVAVNFFPGKGDVFDLVVAPRMERVIRERFLCERS